MQALDNPVSVDYPSIFRQAEEMGWNGALFNFGLAEHPQTDYFNPSIVERPDGRWLIVRRSIWTDRLKFGMNDVMAFKLNGVTPVIGYATKTLRSIEREQFEDPRAIYWRGSTWIGMCNFVWWKVRKWTGAHQVLISFDNQWRQQQRFDIPYGKNGKGVGLNTGHEKNWLFFVHDDRMHLIYQAKPHVVVEFNDNMGIVKEYRTDNPKIEWKWGEIRGGTPPVRAGDEYWTFFHSSLPWTDRYRRYFMGAYAFEAKAPFRITRITKEPLLAGSQEDPWCDSKPLVVFCSGFIMDGSNCLVTFGVNDLKCGWCSIPHSDLERLTA